jgi:KaiC/GvpD/RAD55 family RecA-like ATPase
MELGETTRMIFERVAELNPTRVAFDSLSELRLLAQSSLRYRRQILALKHFFTDRRCTVLVLDDLSSHADDLQLHSIVHGVIRLEQTAIDYGAERRRLRVIKMRGIRSAAATTTSRSRPAVSRSTRAWSRRSTTVQPRAASSRAAAMPRWTRCLAVAWSAAPTPCSSAPRG